jgi:anthranilate synthase/aminodeoxychorismate synthase-like glutamine amidotransferase
MIVLIDNYDSFTYNLVQKLGEIDARRPIQVFRNDKISVDQIESLHPTHIVISPGPCTPKEGGVSNDVIKHFGPKLPVLGVCLGHQCIGYSFGGIVERAGRLMHGKTDQIHHDGRTIYAGMPNPFTATRYHSLIIRQGTMPPEFEITSWTDQDEIMGVRHKTWPLRRAVSPRVFLTEHGRRWGTSLRNDRGQGFGRFGHLQNFAPEYPELSNRSAARQQSCSRPRIPAATFSGRCRSSLPPL